MYFGTPTSTALSNVVKFFDRSSGGSFKYFKSSSGSRWSNLNGGMKGQFNGYSTNGNPKHYKFRSTHIRREKYAKTKDSPFKVAGFKIKQVSEKELQQDLQSIYMGHDRFLRA